MTKKQEEMIERAKNARKSIKDSKVLDIKFLFLVRLVNDCIKDMRKNRPKGNYNYRVLTKVLREEGKIKFKHVGFIRNKEILNDLVFYVYRSDFIQKNYARKTIEGLIIDKLFVDFVYEGNLTKDKIAEEIIKYFEKIHKWKIIFPLDNIELNVPFFQLGNHKIIKFNKYQRSKWRKIIGKFYAHSKYPQNKKTAIKLFDRDFEKFLKDVICAIIQVKRGDSIKAMDEAKKEFQIFLSCIKYMNFIYGGDYRSRRILIPGQNYDRIASFIGFSETAGTAGKYENNNPLPFVLNKNVKKRMYGLGLYKINDILKIDENERTEFQKNILNSIKIYGDAVSDFDLSQSIVKLVTILEFLLIQGREAKSYNLAERLSFLMRREHYERKLYYEHVKSIYNLR
ncbi:MAG: hypothetical protein KAS32_06310, partial [Candidatus Peribacteraceae bacterium]|nr:hypothetical protein [Candidatus Peribacteraceae bacterium]